MLIASGSRWLAAATIMTLVDDGLLGLDDLVSRYVPGIGGNVGHVTLRQLLSHTSVLPAYHLSLDDSSITLAECVDQIAEGGVVTAPGGEFDYGNVSYQVAGRIAEEAGGATWSRLFHGRIARPLGMGAASYGDSANPFLAGGVVSSARDCARFLQMPLDHGVRDGRRILSPPAVDEMQRDQTRGVPIVESLHTDGRRYGLGAWRDVVDAQGNAVQLSSQGDAGFSPWIDLPRRLAGVFLVYDYLGDVEELVAQVREHTRVALDATSAAP